MPTLICSSCGGGDFEVDRAMEKITRGEKHRWVLMESSWCTVCGEDVITTEQIEINEKRINEVFEEQDNE